LSNFRVTFRPSGKSVSVPGGTLILDAAARAGVLIDTPCGGQGRCGRCLVRVEEGEASHRENPHLTPQQMQEGWVLSCTARVAGDLRLAVPRRREREKVVAETAAARTARPVECDWPRSPTVRQVFVELTPPTLEDTATDLERLKTALAAQHQIDSLRVELPLMRRLARELRQANWQLTLTLDTGDGDARLIDIHPGRRRGALLGAAVDIGTTNVVIDLVDLRSGKVVEQVSARNKQIVRGEDVISRIIYSERGKRLEELQRLVVETINELLSELGQKLDMDMSNVQEMVVAGNTTMTHLFLGLSPKHIREEPYVPTATSFPRVRAGELGVAINPLASIYCLPAVAAYVGGDITAGVLSSCLFQADKLSLFLDVGTNGEIVLGSSDWMTTCACSAGPAFEGAGVRHGMRAMKGAIEEVRINSKTLEPTLSVIGGGPPQGICGSGLISALAEMFITGVINRSGRIDMEFVSGRRKGRSRVRRGDHGAEYVLAWARDSGMGEDIILTEVDINNLIRTKAAIYAGIAVMAHSLGIPLSDVEEVLIGGAFGQHINVEEAIQIGLLPDLPWERFRFLGNTSLWGAYNALLSRFARAQVEEIAGKLTYMELIADNTFMNELTGALFLPHTDINKFPSVKALLEENAAQKASP
jgi:uncharacterized 2Fe-2S/4Fe-4S cluster protein (DUF4445 family)